MKELSAGVLDGYADAYKPDQAFALDNDLILNWYPHRVINMVRGGSLLELGVGHGYSTRIFQDHFDRHVVIDGSSKIIDRFRLENPGLKVELTQGYFEDFESDEKFDAICMGFVLEHVDDPEMIVRRYCRFLKPGGSLFAAVPNAESMHRRIGLAAGLMTDVFALGEGDRGFGHQRLYSVATLTALIAGCGYEIVTTEGLFFKPFTTGQIKQLALSPDTLRGMMEVGISYPELCCAIMTHARLPL